jgi:hypothetical protein
MAIANGSGVPEIVETTARVRVSITETLSPLQLVTITQWPSLSAAIPPMGPSSTPISATTKKSFSRTTPSTSLTLSTRR